MDSDHFRANIVNADPAKDQSEMSGIETRSHVRATELERIHTIPITREPSARDLRHPSERRHDIRSENVAHVVNVVLASLGLVVASPLLLVAAILVKLSSPGPIFYAQARVGLDRRRTRGPSGIYDRRTRDLGG